MVSCSMYRCYRDFGSVCEGVFDYSFVILLILCLVVKVISCFVFVLFLFVWMWVSRVDVVVCVMCVFLVGLWVLMMLLKEFVG